MIPTILIRKKKNQPNAVNEVIDGLALGTAVESMIAIHKRVTKGAGTATKAPAYGTGNRLVSPRYPHRGPGGKEVPSGAIWYPASADLHADVRPNSFDVSGGLWNGRAIEAKGARTAILAFRGRSEGQGMKLSARLNRGTALRVFKRRKGAHTRKLGSKRAFKQGKEIVSRENEEPYFDSNGKAVPRKVSNALKAASVFQTKGVNLLELTQKEMVGIAEGAVEATFRGVMKQTSAEIQAIGANPRSVLAMAIARRVTR